MKRQHSHSDDEATEVKRSDIPSTSGQTPSRQRELDEIIFKVAEALSNDSDVRRLGLELDISNHDINRALETNWAGGVKTSNGNVVMLQNWAIKVKSPKHLPTLGAALKKAGLVEVAETYLPIIPTDEPEVLPDDILKLKEHLQRRYRNKYSNVKTSPVDPESKKLLQHIYVSLVLMLGQGRDEEKPIDYEGLFKYIRTEAERGCVTRFAFIGEAGFGKTTLFAKIALDWANGDILQEIDLLLLESFREIEESRYLGEIVMGHFPDDKEIKGAQVDEYIRKHPRKAVIMLDGLDEAKIDIKDPNDHNSVASIVRGERFIDTPVLTSTRPFGADQIKDGGTIHDQYTFVKVEGFSKESTSEYINQYFEDDEDCAASLIRFVQKNTYVTEHMAHIPIFCCMLCYMWKTPSTRESLLKIETLPQLLELLVFSLREQYCSKVEGGYEEHWKKATGIMKEAGRVAFRGLLAKQFTFDEDQIGSEVGMIACEVGLLSEEKRLAPMEIRKNQGKQFIHEFSFPHKLLQEYTSSFYLASLFDGDRPEFNRILADKLLQHYKEFRYVLYFTAALGGEVGKSVIEGLCKKVNDKDFIIQVAFECHDTGTTIDSVRNLLKKITKLTLTPTRSAAYFFTLETLGKEFNKESLSSSPTHLAGVGLFTLPKLRSLVIRGLDDEDFFKGIQVAASQSKIEKLKHDGGRQLCPSASSHYARGIFSMPHLRTLILGGIKLSDEFFSVMAKEASKSKIEELRQVYVNLGPVASSHYARGIFSMPLLRSLTLGGVRLDDVFYSVMAEQASMSKIQMLSLTDIKMSRRSVNSILSLPCLQSLSLQSVNSFNVDGDEQMLSRHNNSVIELALDDEHINTFWKLRLQTSCSQVQKLTLHSFDKQDVSLDTVSMACSPLKLLTDLHIHGGYKFESRIPHHEPFCNAVITSCPRLTKLSITRVRLSNEKATEIIKSMKTHPHLTSITMTECDTDMDLDPLIVEVNSEGKLTVNAEHGWTQ